MRSRLAVFVAALTLAFSTGLTSTADAAQTRFLTLPFARTKGMHIQRAWGQFPDGFHHAIDYIKGTPGAIPTWKSFPVLAAAPGLACAQKANKKGCIELPDEKLTDRVLIKHRIDGRTYYTLYQHVAKLDPRIPLGGKTVRVKRGQRIGRTGRDEGAASLIHLHFELLDAKLRAIDPYQIYKTSPYYPDPAGRNRVKAKRGHFWLQNPPQPPDTEKSTRRAGEPETSPAASPLASPATVGASPGPSTVPTACGPPAAPSPVASASLPPVPSMPVLAPPSVAASPAMIPAASCAPIASFVPLPSPGASFIVLASPAATAPPA